VAHGRSGEGPCFLITNILSLTTNIGLGSESCPTCGSATRSTTRPHPRLHSPTGKSHTFIISPCVRSPTCMLAPLHPTCGSGPRSTTRPPPQLDTPQAKVTNLSFPHVSSPQHACSHTHTHTQAHTQHTHLHLTCGSGTRSTTRPPPRLHSPAMARRMEVLPAPEGPIISSGLPRAT